MYSDVIKSSMWFLDVDFSWKIKKNFNMKKINKTAMLFIFIVNVEKFLIILEKEREQERMRENFYGGVK